MTGRRTIFYGWYVLVGSVVIELFGLGFGIFAITTVYPYIIRAFPDWSRTLIFLPTTLIILTVAALGPLVGTLIDRYPIRAVFAVGIVIESVALLLFSRVATPAEYVASSVLLGVGMSCVTILPNQVLVSRWFHQRIGLVNGIVLAATAMGAAMAPALITRLIEVSDWRAAFSLMAILAFAPPMVVVLALIRDRPEALGLQPYGAATAADAAALSGAGISLGEAARLPFFWLFAAAVVLGGMPCYSFNKHILVFLQELGYSPVAAADYKSFFFFVAGCARLSFGWLCDRFDKRMMTVAHFAMIAAGYPLLFLVPDHPGILLPCLFIVGVGYGGLLPAIPILVVATFGRLHLGKILGVYKISYDLAAAGAPLFTASMYDRYGGYAVPERWNATFAWIGLALLAAAVRRQPAAASLVPAPANVHAQKAVGR